MVAKETIKWALKPVKSWLVGDSRTLMMKSYQLMGRMANWQVRFKTVVSLPQDAEFNLSMVESAWSS